MQSNGFPTVIPSKKQKICSGLPWISNPCQLKPNKKRKTLKDTLTCVGAKVAGGKHPKIWHNQSVTGRPMGMQLCWRAETRRPDGSHQPLFGIDVAPSFYNPQLESILIKIKDIPWLSNRVIRKIETTISRFQEQVKIDFEIEARKGKLSFTNEQKRADYVLKYATLWRSVCKKLFPNLIKTLEQKVGKDYQDIPITANLSYEVPNRR